MKENISKVSAREAAEIILSNGKLSTRFVVSLDSPQNPLVVDGTGIFNKHKVLQLRGEIGTAAGGFCIVQEDDLVFNPEQSPHKMPQATEEQFTGAKSNGVVVFG